MLNLFRKIDMWCTRWNFTDDVADILWRGRCRHAIVAVSEEFEDMESVFEYARYLRRCGDWTVAVRRYDFVERDELRLVQYRGRSLFRWTPAIRTDYFGPPNELVA